jgi:hypothetical protein
VPIARARGITRARRRTVVRRASVACALTAAVAASGAAAAVDAAPPDRRSQEYALARSEIRLNVTSARLGAWSPLVARRGAKVRFSRGTPSKRVLTLADRPRRAGYVTVSTSVPPKTIVTTTAKLNLTRQKLRRGKLRALVAVAGADGNAYQAGVLRRRTSGRMVWAAWIKTPSGRQIGIRTGRRATLRDWHALRLRTRWGARRSRAVLHVDGVKMATTPARNLAAVAGERVILGLGRTSKRTETGSLLVRSAKVRLAGPVLVRRPAPGTGAPVPPPPPSDALPGKEILRADYETGSLSQWNANQAVAADRISVVSDTVRQGAYAARFEVRNGDNPIGYGDRAEVQTSTGEREGQERWYGWSTMFAPDYPTSSSWQVVSQWHANADGSPPLAFFAQGDELKLVAHRFSAPGVPIDIVDIWRGPLRRGAWQDIKLHVLWSGSDSTGFVELWVDGVQQTFDDGSARRQIRTLYPGVGAYFKQGLYRQSGIPQTGVVYHDGFRMNAP